ncbi:MAG: glycosyltransferase family 8 protein [Sphingomonadales bacterium]
MTVRHGGKNAICLCVDRNMIVPALFVACAVARHANRGRDDHDLVIVVPPGDLDAAHRDFARSRNILIDETMELDSIRDIRVSEARLSSATLMRLLLAGHYEGKYEKILYLDADLTIHEGPGRLFDIDMEGHSLAAVPSGRVLSDLPDKEAKRITSHFSALGMTPPYRYFNAGVMLIDPSKWMKERITERALDFVRKNPELCALPDEDALNAVLDGAFLELSPIWNARPDRLWASDFEPAIVHYAGVSKPWIRFGRYKRFRELRSAYRCYAKFIGQTPWPTYLRSRWGFKDVCGSMVREGEYLVSTLIAALSGKKSGKRRAFREEYRKFTHESDFADVRQGLATRERGFIRCSVDQEVRERGVLR